MDESWRIRMGMNIPRRRSTEETSSDRMRRSIFGFEASVDPPQSLNPEDFQDVFGGPPRSIFFRQFSGDLSAAANRSTTSESFYEEIFRSPESFVPSRSGRNLPVFRIPSGRGGGGGVGGFRRSDGFYDDIFGSDDDRRLRSRSKSDSKSKSKSKSKSNSSSVLSSEDLSPLRPLRPPISEDVCFSSFASKLRPINVPFRRNSSSVTPEQQQKRHGISTINPCNRASHMDFQLTDISQESYRSTHFGFSRQVPSPETINLDPIPYPRTKMAMDNVEDPDSPRSAVSSLCREPEAKPSIEIIELHDQEDDEVMSSYVIEITSNKMEGTDGVVDEAIAWAKETFLTQSYEGLKRDYQNDRDHYPGKEERRIKLDQRMDPAERMQFLTALDEPKKWAMGEGKLQSEKEVSFP